MVLIKGCTSFFRTMPLKKRMCTTSKVPTKSDGHSPVMTSRIENLRLEGRNSGAGKLWAAMSKPTNSADCGSS